MAKTPSPLRRRRLRRVSFAAYLTLALLLAGCVSSTQRVLEKWTGRKIADFISEKSYYPDSTDPLPSGNTVYRFTVGSGGRVDQYGRVRSNVCRVWIEADPSGTIVRWRYENCS